MPLKARLGKLRGMIGREYPLLDVSRAIRELAQALEPACVGAHQIACSDESEKENMVSFHKTVVRELLPEHKFWSRSAFRSVNLGGRYESGSLPIAEAHYATAVSSDDHPKLLIVKLNSHVSVDAGDDGPFYGRKTRYERECSYCGALHELLEGKSDLPYQRELKATFGERRLAHLRDADANVRALLAAVTNARLQAALATEDISAHEPRTPTLYILVACVTLNRSRPDTELVVGLSSYDSAHDTAPVWVGLGDDPERYQVAHEGGAVTVTEAD